jgi:hypothetical protein
MIPQIKVLQHGIIILRFPKFQGGCIFLNPRVILTGPWCFQCCLGTNGGPTAPAKGHWAYLGLGADLGCRNGGFTLDITIGILFKTIPQWCWEVEMAKSATDGLRSLRSLQRPVLQCKALPCGRVALQEESTRWGLIPSGRDTCQPGRGWSWHSSSVIK